MKQRFIEIILISLLVMTLGNMDDLGNAIVAMLILSVIYAMIEKLDAPAKGGDASD